MTTEHGDTVLALMGADNKVKPMRDDGKRGPGRKRKTITLEERRARQAIYSKRHYQKHRDELLQKSREYYKQNSEAINKRTVAHRRNHPEQAKMSFDRYYNKNKHEIYARYALRRQEKGVTLRPSTLLKYSLDPKEPSLV